MGSKKSTHTTVTTTVKTNVVKLTYLQTLAANDNLISVQGLNTEGFDKKQTSNNVDKSTKLPGGVGLALGGIGLSKKKTTTTGYEETSGAKVKDTWLQPYFDRIAYKIGVKEFNVSRYTFVPSAEFTSVPFKSPKEIVKASIIVDEYLPPTFDSAVTWLRYYIKIEGQDTWIRVNPMNKPTTFDEAGLIIPKIINFNLPKPGTAQLEDKYQTTEEPVKQLRFRAVITRPEGDGNEASITPLLKSYRITMVPRE